MSSLFLRAGLSSLLNFLLPKHSSYLLTRKFVSVSPVHATEHNQTGLKLFIKNTVQTGDQVQNLSA